MRSLQTEKNLRNPIVNRYAVLAVVSFMLAAIPVWAQNPDEGMLTRIICYQTDVQGDASARRNDFAVILQQTSIEEHDASFYVMGNQNFRDENVTNKEPFAMYVYHRPGGIDWQRDPLVVSEELLAEKTSLPVVEAEGRRHRSYYQALIPSNGDQPAVIYDYDQPENQSYMWNRNLRYLLCEEPFAVPAD